MKAFSKRVLSLTMATAMALSIAAVPTTDANAASKYSLTKRTAAYTGKTYNYYLKGVSKSQYAKVSVSGTAKNLVTVKLGSKKIKSSTKINGTGKTLKLKVKASKASGKKYALSAKIYNKKTKKLVKTLKTPTVTVYNNYIKSISGETTVDAGKTTTLKAVKKYSQSTKAVTWSSSNTAVATVAADGTVTGVAAGSSVITATCGNYSKSVRVTVMPVAEAKGVSAVLTNGVAGYTDVAYVNQDAVVVVTARDENGKAVPNASVVMQAPTATSTTPGVVGDKAKTTDANGQATFVIGYTNSGNNKITNTDLVGTVAYTVSVNANIANVETTVKGNVRFAALNIDNIEVDHDKNDGDSYFTDLQKGTQVDDTDSLERTIPLHRDNSSYWASKVANEYVATQQVSEAGKNNHEVVFEVKPSLKVPGTVNTATGVLENTVLVGKETGAYDTYDNKTAVATIEEDTSLLRYATLYVTDINLSKYSHLEVQSYTDKDDKFDHPVGEKQYVYGEQKQGT
ncbi:MAG: Ig-like domain-containing protein, partial [Agathobacter sp.]|nr:Ig-like domain-containing protein [Agathobacter sp.]